MLNALRSQLHEGLKTVGNSQSPFVRKLAHKFFPQVSHHHKRVVIDVAEDLMESRNTWEHMIACAWIEKIQNRLEKPDFYVFERWLYQYVFSWGTCDDLCKRVLNPLVEKYPSLFDTVMKWTASEIAWVRRASAVSLIGTKKSRYYVDFGINCVLKVAKALLMDTEHYVQKGYGWMLKAASLKYKEEVIAFLIQNQPKMPRMAFRYALENLADRDRARIK